MRHWITLVEKVLDTFSSPYSPEKTQLYYDPSAAEFRSLLSKLKRHESVDPEGTMRGLLHPGDQGIYIWDGYYSTHGAIIDTWGLEGSFHLILDATTVRVLTLWRYERAGFSEDAVRKLVEQNPHLKAMYRGRFDVVIEGGTPYGQYTITPVEDED